MKNNVEIIAEIGVNHNGDMCLAKDMIDAARASGATCVKFQLFSTEKLVSKSSLKAAYQIRNTGDTSTQMQMLRQLEFGVQDMLELQDYSARANVSFLLSAFDDLSLEALISPLQMSKIKIPSGEITNIPMLIKIGSNFDQIILSTGMCNLTDIELAISALCYGRSHKNGPNFKDSHDAINNMMLAYNENAIRNDVLNGLTILQCTSDYPAPSSEANLLAMKNVGNAFGCNYGFSDHTEGRHVALAAVALGATTIEKHFTLDKNLPGPDHAASSTPEEFRKLTQEIDDILDALGSGIKHVVPSEFNTISKARKFLTAGRAIRRGDIFTEENITYKRGIGRFPPLRIYDFFGKVSDKDYDADGAIE